MWCYTSILLQELKNLCSPGKRIPYLVRYIFGISYLDIYIVVRVPIYLIINADILDIVYRFHREGFISMAIGELW